MIKLVGITDCQQCPHRKTEPAKVTCRVALRDLTAFHDLCLHTFPEWCPLETKKKSLLKLPKSKQVIFATTGFQDRLLYPVLKSYWQKNKHLSEQVDEEIIQILDSLGWTELMEGAFIRKVDVTAERAIAQLRMAGFKYSKELEKYLRKEAERRSDWH